MAIAIGNIVSPSAFQAFQAPPVRGPVFGNVASGAGPFSVVWNDGSFVANIPGVGLDLIGVAADATKNALVGRRVKVSSPSGQDNWGICTCVSVYTRDNNGGGNPYTVALLQNEQGFYIEALAANCSAVQ